MTIALLSILVCFVTLLWSADRFVEGAAMTAQHIGVSSLLIGMVIVGFGTSAPEMAVSALAALHGNPELALGNAIGSNIVNTGLVLGVTALVIPLSVHSKIVRRELPLLFLIGLLTGAMLLNSAISRLEASILLLGFFVVIAWTIYAAMRGHGDALESDTERELEAHSMPISRAILWLLVGIIVLVLSSRILVWGAITVAQILGVSDLLIGLTIVALGTSLPELAASVIAARKGEHDIAIGNLVGSNMFNLLAVIGIAGYIAPMQTLSDNVFTRDWAVMMAMITALYVMTFRLRTAGRISRKDGLLLVISFVAYKAWLVTTVMVSP